MNKFKPGSSFVIAEIAERYGIDYGVVLNYVDAMRTDRLLRTPHHSKAVEDVLDVLGFHTPRASEFSPFHSELRQQLRKIKKPNENVDPVL